MKKPDGNRYIDPNSEMKLQKIFCNSKEKNDFNSNNEELTQSSIWRFAKKLRNMIAILRKSKGGRHFQQKIDSFIKSTYNL